MRKSSLPIFISLNIIVGNIFILLRNNSKLNDINVIATLVGLFILSFSARRFLLNRKISSTRNLAYSVSIPLIITFISAMLALTPFNDFLSGEKGVLTGIKAIPVLTLLSATGGIVIFWPYLLLSIPGNYLLIKYLSRKSD